MLAFYYGWYGNPATSGGWRHWKGVDGAGKRIENTEHYPLLGAYDSHDPQIVDKQAEEARAAAVTGFIASWWGRDSFEDRGVPLLLAAAGRHGLAVSAYYEKIDGADAPSREKAAIADLDYLLVRYGGDPAWLRVGGKPVVFIYGRALQALSPQQWREVLGRVRSDNAQGAVFVADGRKPPFGSLFNGTSNYNVTSQTRDKTPQQIRTWAHKAYRDWVALAGPGTISTVTVIPGYDDRATGRPPPRPITDRWGGETYRVLWQEAIAARPDWVLITSWNEWHEGSEIEPSLEYGRRALDDTAVFSRQFMSLDRTRPLH